MQRKKQSATLSQLALHFSVVHPQLYQLACVMPKKTPPNRVVFFFGCDSMLRSYHLGYETDERSSLGHEPDRRRWREEGGRSECRGLYFQGGFDRRRKYRAPQTGRYAEPHFTNVRHKDNKSRPASATNNANRFRYRGRKVRNRYGFGLFLYKFCG